MIKHLTCNKEYQDKLKVRFYPIYCESLVFYDPRNNGLYVELPFSGTQIYVSPKDMINKPECQAEVFCPICNAFYPITEFKFYMACMICNKKSKNLVKVYCRKNKPNTLYGCVGCIQERCTSKCGRQRGLCESYRKVIYTQQPPQRPGRRT